MQSDTDFNTMKARIQIFAKPKISVYWLDYVLSSGLGWGFFFLASKIHESSLVYFLLIFLSAIGLYRASAFTHELVHMRKNAIPGFYTVWHLASGLPLLAPHFLYRAIHIAHHSKKDYGKSTDGEYLEFGLKSRALIVLHFMSNFMIPFLSIVRFMFVAPLSLVHNKWRRFVMENMSFMGLKFTFKRKIPVNNNDQIKWYVEEFSCTLLLWILFSLYWMNLLPVIVFVQWYVVVFVILTLNSLRTLGATHWYISKGNSMGMKEQVNDSINIQNSSIFTQIFCPVGTQYHALHHMFPFLPYHSLRAAYDCLVNEFPQEKILKATTKNSLFECWQINFLTPRKQSEGSLCNE